ncbi:MAG: glycosyl hydrolase family 31 [Anaerolineales bacterium]|nr:glycosyl hydrolase family 31 [Anaerolineales bacterium]
MQTIEAQVIDNTHLRLLQPIQLPRLTRVIIAVMQLDGDEREVWLQTSVGQLNRAYGDNEPEYLPEQIKQPNPEFVP